VDKSSNPVNPDIWKRSLTELILQAYQHKNENEWLVYNNKCNNNKSSPKSFENNVSLSPRLRMHSPTACASCAMRNVNETVTEHYWSIMEPLRNVTGALWSRCWMLWGYYGNVMESCWDVTEALQNVTFRKTYFCFRDVFHKLTSIPAHISELWCIGLTTYKHTQT